jgi:hypothetical protein
MHHFGSGASTLRWKRRLGKAEKMQRKATKVMPAMLAAGFMAALAGCAQPAPVAYAPPPPPPVGHPYQVMVAVPPPVRHIRITSEQQQELQQAFNVIALKSALMVAALTCNQQDQYDQFMTTFQPHVLAEQHVMDAYFKRGSGYYGQAKEDDFVTLLANNQSVGGIGQGAVFCINNSAEFKAVLALKTPSDLDNFVTDLPPNSAVVVASAPSVTPLSPGNSVNIAVVQSSKHVNLVQTHPHKHWIFSEAHPKHIATPASTNTVAAASAPAKPVSLAAAVPQ